VDINVRRLPRRASLKKESQIVNRKLARIASLIAAGAMLLSVAVPASAADTSMVRVLHASPDAPAVDVYLDGTKVSALTNVPFGVISGYLPIPAGAHNVKVYATGTTTGAVIDANVTVAAGKMYTIAATSAVATITAQVIEDDPTPDCSTAQVRVIHFSADAPAVDIATTGAAPADAVVKSLAYPSASGYLDLPGGSYDLEVRLAGTTTVALPLPGVAIADCTSYSVFAVGSAANPAVGGKALQVVVAVDGTASASAPTPPPTDTRISATGSSAGGLGLGAGIIAAVAVLGFLASLSFVTRRARQD
jgi:hypothetical protein